MTGLVTLLGYFHLCDVVFFMFIIQCASFSPLFFFYEAIL
jgi:hypothetical protein